MGFSLENIFSSRSSDQHLDLCRLPLLIDHPQRMPASGRRPPRRLTSSDAHERRAIDEPPALTTTTAAARQRQALLG